MRKESQLLQSLARHTSVPVPVVKATGVLEEFPYMVLSIIPGQPLHRALGALSDEESQYLLTDVGHVLRGFHDHRPTREECPDFDDFYFSRSDWWNYLERRKQNVLKEIAPTGSEWADRFVDFVDQTLSTMEPRLVLVHGDLQSAHIIVTQMEGKWVVSGVIDVPKVSMGTPEYDWAYLPDCIGWERATLLPIVLSAYGYVNEIDENLSNCLLVNYIFGPQNPLLNLLNNSITQDIEPGDYTELSKRLFRPIGRQAKWRGRFH